MKNTIKILSLSIAAMTVFAGCKKNFEEFNTGLSGLTDAQLNADYTKVIGPMKEVQRNLINQTNWIYQLQQNLNADVYSGYFMSPTTYGGDNNTNYFMKDGWNDRIMTNQLDDVFQKIANFTSGTKVYAPVTFNQSSAILAILGIIEAQKVADTHGPVIYSKFGKPNADLSIDFDSQQAAYINFFTGLDDAIANLKTTASTGDVTALKAADMVYGGDVNKWIKLANTLRLRMAIRIRYADGATAKTQGEKALSAAGGLIEANTDNAFINYGAAHPASDIINAWGDCRSGAPLGAILGGLGDPRLPKYMAPAADGAVSGQFIGIRNGITLVDNDRYRNYSKPLALSADGDYFSATAGKAKLLCAAETWFLKAEAALLGWANAGSIQTDYENGVKVSFEEWGVSGSLTAYLANNTSVAKPYVDPKAVVAGQNDVLATSPNLSKITIKWDGAATTEQQLERIITQKWIAIYPDGQEAWSEFRRTGYPKLFPVVNNASSGTISTTGFIRRIPFSSKFINSNPAGVQRAIATLNGPDNGGTKLWWDKKP